MKKTFTKTSIKIASLLLALLLGFTTVIGSTAFASNSGEPYDSYNYDYWGYIHYTPAPYSVSGTIRGTDFTYNGESIGAFSTPQDFCKDNEGNVYIADTGNSRIVVLNPDMTKVVKIVSSFDNNGKADKFRKPYGVCVSSNNRLYIADTQNKRIVVLNNEDDTLYQIIENPQSESFDASFSFSPLKVTVDYADRVYCIAKNMFEGIMVFETDGKFSTFFGTIKVTISLWEKFWRRIATKEERSNQKLFIATEFTGLDIDPDGFVYATNIDATGIQGVRRLNPSGQDVIKKGENENLGGDLRIDGTTDYAGASQFVDLVYRNDGIYSCLDKKRGRIFTYDHEGNLLYIFGGLGTQIGSFKLPVAIENIGDKILILDATRAQITVFNVTEYGDLINRAVALRYDGDETQAVALWERVLELDEDNELANIGIGKAYLSSGDYEQAMKYLKIGENKDYYSIAFKRYRNRILVEYIGYVLTAVAVLIVAGLVWKRYKKKRKGATENE
ncbi:MAG: tetratricopeptide repeat protein [Lachnospiraceae bacterium]|nr:tetratricopeptide repeat protein [Lachnospiraceae bacterium]